MRNSLEVQEHRLDDWDSFEAQVVEIDRETQKLRTSRSLHVSDPLYRGQRDAAWHLATTLDRQRPGITLDKYLTFMERIQPRIEGVYRRKWPTLSEEISGLRRNGLDSIWLFPVRSANTRIILSFMVYLRQHGFPSPFLDWTDDPYRAAFFAFAGIAEGAERVAIFAFREWTGAMGYLVEGTEPTVMGLGPHILNTSPRHSKQRAQYTLCVERSASGTSLDCYIFADHERAINLPGFRMEAGVDVDEDRAQNVVDKYTIPASEQRKVLTSLAQRHISRCGLFGRSADALLEDIWNELIVDSAV